MPGFLGLAASEYNSVSFECVSLEFADTSHTEYLRKMVELVSRARHKLWLAY